jgi:hypothetical protein|tara:strand:- start:515 stop:1159 length:645 start_codon:yes stop_codon:yes gene_type:complete
MDFEKTIGIFPDALSKSECQLYIDWFEENKELQQDGQTLSGVNNNVKNTKDISILPDNPLSNLLAEKSNELVETYLKSFGHLEEYNPLDELFTQGSHYPYWNVQRYRKNVGHYKSWHTEQPEQKNTSNRMFVVMYYLNNVDKGGHTLFLLNDMKVKPTRGTFLVWPAGWPYVHSAETPLSNDKYIITTWLNANFNPYRAGRVVVKKRETREEMS